jgi:hypothetical protein
MYAANVKELNPPGEVFQRLKRKARNTATTPDLYNKKVKL